MDCRWAEAMQWDTQALFLRLVNTFRTICEISEICGKVPLPIRSRTLHRMMRLHGVSNAWTAMSDNFRPRLVVPAVFAMKRPPAPIKISLAGA